VGSVRTVSPVAPVERWHAVSSVVRLREVGKARICPAALAAVEPGTAPNPGGQVATRPVGLPYPAIALGAV